MPRKVQKSESAPVSPMTSELMEVADVAQYLKISESQVYQLMKDAGLPHYQWNRNTRFRRAKIDAWLEQYEMGKAS